MTDIGKEQLIAQLTESNWGLIQFDSDSITSRTWKIFRNKRFICIYNRTISGNHCIVDKELDENDFELVKDKIQCIYSGDDSYSACDGTGYKMELYSEDGAIEHQFIGYIYGIKELEDLITFMRSLTTKYSQ